MADKRAKVIMLPTENISSIFLNKHVNKSHSISPISFDSKPDMTSSEMQECGLEYQYLYFTTDEKIKEDDWVLLNYPSGKEVKQMVDGVPFENVECIRGENLVHNCGHRKIVATTDKSLKVLSTCCNGTGYDKRSRCRDCDGLGLQPLPQPSQAFIEKYCKVSGIDEVLIEYITYEQFNGSLLSGHTYPKKTMLNVDLRHNTIIIHPVKNSWNEDEMRDNMQYYMEYCKSNKYVTPKEWLRTHKHF